MPAGKSLISKATVHDVKSIYELLTRYAQRNLMLPRSLGELYENVQDFSVVRKAKKVVACGALHVVWEDLAEIKSLAVAQEYQHDGLGTRLVQACLRKAPSLGLRRVFVLTYVPGFFEALGFSRVDKEALPHKIWSECLKCPNFPDCGETALIRSVS